MTNTTTTTELFEILGNAEQLNATKGVNRDLANEMLKGIGLQHFWELAKSNKGVFPRLLNFDCLFAYFVGNEELKKHFWAWLEPINTAKPKYENHAFKTYGNRYHYAWTKEQAKQLVKADLARCFPGVKFTFKKCSSWVYAYDVNIQESDRELSEQDIENIRQIISEYLYSEANTQIDYFGYSNNEFRLSKCDYRIVAPKAKPEKTKPIQTPQPQPQISDIVLSEYSDKAIVVRGNTFPIKDKLKELGGKWNNNLQGGAGWIFSKKQTEAVKTALGL
jgi:hypothetical protein